MSKKQIEIEARTPDAFLTGSERILKWVEDNIAVVGGIFGAILLIGLGWLGYGQFNDFQERRATKAIYAAQMNLNKQRDQVAKDENERLEKLLKEMKDKGAKDLPQKEDSKADFEAVFAGPAQEVEKQIIAHKSTKAAAIAAIDLAGLYLDQKKPDLAAALLAQVDGGDSEIIRALVKMQRSTVAMELGDYNRAISGFEDLAGRSGVEFIHAEALLKAGLCYERLEQMDRAKDLYTRVSTEFGESESGRTAKNYLRLLQLNSAEKTPEQKNNKG